jgi:hypothetical protein
VATWFWQTEGRSTEREILGVQSSEFILLELLSPSRRSFIASHSLPTHLWSPNRSFRREREEKECQQELEKRLKEHEEKLMAVIK